jgi:hypothetical protein
VGRALADHNGGQTRILMWPMLLILLGPPLVPIWLAGLVAVLRRPEWRPIRFIGAAFPVLLVLVFVMGSQFYYPFGLLAVLYAIGLVPTVQWLRRGAARHDGAGAARHDGAGAARHDDASSAKQVGAGTARRNWVVAGLAVNGVVSLLIGLPVIPLSALGDTPVPGINQAARDTVGWPRYVDEVDRVYAALPAGDRANAIIVATNYGEAGALARYGRGLPAIYSGQNALYEQARPPAEATVAIVVGGQFRSVQRLFARCQVQARLDDRVGVDNEEQDRPIAVCRDPAGGWSAAWPHFHHLD